MQATDVVLDPARVGEAYGRLLVGQLVDPYARGAGKLDHVVEEKAVGERVHRFGQRRLYTLNGRRHFVQLVLRHVRDSILRCSNSPQLSELDRKSVV